MKKHNFIKYLLFLLLITANIGCDQISKSVVREHLDYQERISMVDDHVMLTKVENSGAFLSLGDSMTPTAKALLLNLFPVLSLLAILFWLFRVDMSKGMAFGLCCVVGGGIGNVFDRIVHGSVTDFLYMHAGIFRTGIFNFADVSITGGVLFILALQIFRGKQVVKP